MKQIVHTEMIFNGVIEVLVDIETSKENVSRAAESKGWAVSDVKEEGEGYRVTLARS